MICPGVRALFLGAFITVVAPVRAQCHPSHAIVAVASVLSTLAVVTVFLIGIYFFLSWKRKKGSRLPKNVYEVKKQGDGHSNHGFTDNESLAVIEGVTTPRRRGQAHFSEQVSTGDNSKQWPSPPRSERLYRKGSVGSLDQTAKFVEAEIISVTLESQDIIGLGFNICGNYGDGIRVSEVHNRGPAKESGNIHIGDKILSVAVSYQNIVYEDALTILSYASPYPVKIILEKAIDIGSHHFEDEKQNEGKRTHRITHPLFRSRSLNTLKQVQHSDSTTHPKRAVSDLKLESVKYFMNWRSKNSKRENINSPENGTSFAKKLTAHRDKRDGETKATNRTAEYENEVRLGHSSYENRSPGYGKFSSTLHETVAEVTPVSHGNTADKFQYQESQPGKPEHKVKRESNMRNLTYLEDHVTTSARAYSYPISSVTDDEIDVDEIDVDEIDVDAMFLVPAIASHDVDTDSCGNVSQCAEITEAATVHNNFAPQTPTKNDSSDGSCSEKTSCPAISTDILIRSHKPNNNSRTSAGQLNPFILQEEPLSTTPTAINTVAANTPSLSGLLAAERQNDSVHDFAANQPQLTSNSTFISHELSLNNCSDGEQMINEHALDNSRNVSSDVDVKLVPGNPFAAEITEQLVQAKLSQNSDKNSNVAGYSNLFPTSVSFLSNKTSSRGSNSSTASPANTDLSEISDTLEWSGTRLVRSESFSNIFVDD